MALTDVLDLRTKQIKHSIENSFFSEEATISIKGNPSFTIKGIHKWGPALDQLGTRTDRFGTRHSFSLCSVSLPKYADKDTLIKQGSLALGSSVFRILQITESFAKYNLIIAPKTGKEKEELNAPIR